MKVLWLSPVKLSDSDDGGGSWIRAMAPNLLRTGQVTLANITVDNVSRTVRHDYGEINQWIVPGVLNSNKNIIPSEEVIFDIVQAANEFQPDIVHVWGTEYFLGLLTARKYLSYPSLLEIQGLKRPYSRFVDGGLSFREKLACIGLKEIIRKSSIAQRKKKFFEWALVEDEIIIKHSNITVQSLWVEAWVKFVNPACNLFQTDLVLRDAFYESMPWEPSGNFTIFTSSVASAPHKGIHDAIRAISILRARIPSIKLRIAGSHQRMGIRQDGYIRWINALIKQLDLSNNIAWLGPLTAEEIVEELKKCDVALVSSYCETYCVAFAEAMQLGVPIVTSFTGGAAWLAKDGESALFYPAGDEVMCAHQLWRILTDSKLAERLAQNGREAAKTRNDPNKIILNQLDIYRRVLGSNVPPN